MESTSSKPDSPMRILNLDTFEVPISMGEEQKKEYSRRFLTLFVPANDQGHAGGSGYVSKVTNANGETFALKRMNPLQRPKGTTDEQFKRFADGQIQAFRREYENQQQLSTFKGFPKLYGFGSLEGKPVIVMEWIDGVTIGHARTQLSGGSGANQVPPLSVAEVGKSLFDLLARMDYLDANFVHRDLSPNNIMLRTDEHTIEQQRDSGVYDVCLIDFGSSSATNLDSASFTMTSRILRKATPEYAPPEMLSDDIPNIEVVRKSSTIDVYAACSVLYELMDGSTPYRLGRLAERPPSYYRYKRDHSLALPVSAHERNPQIAAIIAEDEPRLHEFVQELARREGASFNEQRLLESIVIVNRQLAYILMQGIEAQQAERPSCAAMHDMLETFEKNYFVNIDRKYHNEALLPFKTKNYDPHSRPARYAPSRPQPQIEPTILVAEGVVPQPQLYSTYGAVPPSADKPIPRTTFWGTCTIGVVLMACVCLGVTALCGNLMYVAGDTLSPKTLTANPLLLMAALVMPPIVSLPFFRLPVKIGNRVALGTASLAVSQFIAAGFIWSTNWVDVTTPAIVGCGMIALCLIVFLCAWFLFRTKIRANV